MDYPNIETVKAQMQQMQQVQQTQQVQQIPEPIPQTFYYAPPIPMPTVLPQFGIPQELNREMHKANSHRKIVIPISTLTNSASAIDTPGCSVVLIVNEKGALINNTTGLPLLEQEPEQDQSNTDRRPEQPLLNAGQRANLAAVANLQKVLGFPTLEPEKTEVEKRPKELIDFMAIQNTTQLPIQNSTHVLNTFAANFTPNTFSVNPQSNYKQFYIPPVASTIGGIYNRIKETVNQPVLWQEALNNYEPLRSLIGNPDPNAVAIGVKNMGNFLDDRTISQGDLLVGFYLPKEVLETARFEGIYGDQRYNFIIVPGEFKYAMKESCPIPLVTAQNPEFRIRSLLGSVNQLRVIMAHVYDSKKNILASTNQIVKSGTDRFLFSKKYSGQLEQNNTKYLDEKALKYQHNIVEIIF